MSKYLSNRQKNLKIGISSYTENSTVLEVTGKVGIGTTNATQPLDVNGNIRLRKGIIDNNNSYTVFPNNYTLLREYEFTEPDTYRNNKCYHSFDNDDSTYWVSANIYNPDNGFTKSSPENQYKFQSNSFQHSSNYIN